MMRDSVVVKAHATPPDCQEARQWFTPVLSGRTGLTERALVEAHLSCCASCRQEEARLYQGATAAYRVAPRLGLLDYFGKAMTLTQIAVAGGAARSERLYALPSIALRLPRSAVTRLERASRTGIDHSAERIARLRPMLASALSLLGWASAHVMQSVFLGFKSFARATANVIVVFRSGLGYFATRIGRLRPRPVVALRTGLGAAGVVAMLTITAYTVQWMSRPQQPARTTPAPLARVDPTPMEALLPSPPVIPLVEPTQAAPAAAPPVRTRQSPSGAAALPPPRASVDDARAAPDSAPEDEAPASNVVGRLSARNRAAAEHDLTALLAGVNGTETGRQRHATFVAVRVVVAHSRYDDFTRGLTRIGAWQLEAARSPLPDTVHMMIRVTD